MNVLETLGEMEPSGEEEEEEQQQQQPPPEEEQRQLETAAAAALTATALASAPARVRSSPLEEDEEAVVVVEGGGQEQELTYELQQGYRILGEFLLEKHRGLTGPFLQPPGGGAAANAAAAGEEEEAVACGVRGTGSGSRPLSQPGLGMCLLKMEEKFSSGQYGGITEFVADFRLMLETCYRLHGVDHWMSKQGQKLEMMLEQKLALLSRHLREKTTIAVTSRGYYGLEDEKGAACTSTRRRSTPRSLAGLTSGVFESIMVQVLRQEEQLRAKEEKRLYEVSYRTATTTEQQPLRRQHNTMETPDLESESTDSSLVSTAYYLCDHGKFREKQKHGLEMPQRTGNGNMYNVAVLKTSNFDKKE